LAFFLSFRTLSWLSSTKGNDESLLLSRPCEIACFFPFNHWVSLFPPPCIRHDCDYEETREVARSEFPYSKPIPPLPAPCLSLFLVPVSCSFCRLFFVSLPEEAIGAAILLPTIHHFIEFKPNSGSERLHPSSRIPWLFPYPTNSMMLIIVSSFESFLSTARLTPPPPRKAKVSGKSRRIDSSYFLSFFFPNPPSVQNVQRF